MEKKFLDYISDDFVKIRLTSLVDSVAFYKSFYLLCFVPFSFYFLKTKPMMSFNDHIDDISIYKADGNILNLNII